CPVALRPHLDDRVLDVGLRRPRRRLELAHLLRRPHPDPGKAAGLAHRIGFGLLSQPLGRARRLGRRVDDVALDVEFPAVIEAAQAARFVTAERERRAPMQAILAQHAEAPVAVTEGHQVFAEQARAHRRAVARRDLLRHAHRQPVPAHDAAHRRARFDTAKEFVLFASQHGRKDILAAPCGQSPSASPGSGGPSRSWRRRLPPIRACGSSRQPIHVPKSVPSSSATLPDALTPRWTSFALTAASRWFTLRRRTSSMPNMRSAPLPPASMRWSKSRWRSPWPSAAR